MCPQRELLLILVPVPLACPSPPAGGLVCPQHELLLLSAPALSCSGLTCELRPGSLAAQKASLSILPGSPLSFPSCAFGHIFNVLLWPGCQGTLLHVLLLTPWPCRLSHWGSICSQVCLPWGSGLRSPPVFARAGGQPPAFF